MLFSITINYINGMLIGRWKLEKQKRAKAVLAINVVINLALLGFFKYYDLIAETLSLIPFINIKPLGIALPIGISFYTFQTMSYPIDVYRGDADVQRNYISFGTFVALFPQLIAGPIVRYKDVADQLSFRASSIDQFSSGVERFMVGRCEEGAHSEQPRQALGLLRRDSERRADLPRLLAGYNCLQPADLL